MLRPYGQCRRGAGGLGDVRLFMTGAHPLTRRGANSLTGDDLPRLLGQPPTDMRTFVRDTRWRWESRQWT